VPGFTCVPTAVCCSVLQCVAVCCCDLATEVHYGARFHGRTNICIYIYVYTYTSIMERVYGSQSCNQRSMLQYVLQCVVVCCSEVATDVHYGAGFHGTPGPIGGT